MANFTGQRSSRLKDFAVGVMSGTSADGVSVALASFKKKSFDLIDYKTFPYSNKISKKIMQAQNLRVSEISSLNFELGQIYAQCVLGLLKKSKISSSRIAVIGSHGQTLFHGPEDPVSNTLQVGEPSVIAEKTGIPVVSDFRTGDIAAGGQGAPLIPFFDDFFWGGGPVRAFQNIGGIANVTVVGRSVVSPIAFDNGPGNCLMDWAVQKIYSGKHSFDRNGELAKKGENMIGVVHQMARHPYFKKGPPKSTGRELFNESFIPAVLKDRIKKSPQDVLSALTYLTAFTIAESYKKFVFPKTKLKEVIISGGGAYNQTLISTLKQLLKPIPVYSIEKFGVPAQAKEPLAFAFFALRALRGQINHLPVATGAKRAVVLGKITPGRNL